MRQIAAARWAACAALLVIGSGASAQDFPNRPLTFHCPGAPSSPIGRYVQSVTQIASKYFGQKILISNLPDPTQTRAATTMLGSGKPDGHSLALLTIMAFRVPHMMRVEWNPLTDFTYVIGLADFGLGLVVKSDSRFKSLKDLVDHAKANPGELRYGSRAHGFTSHLVLEELAVLTGAKMQRLTYGGEGAAQALMDGRIAAISDATSELRRNIDSGAFRLLVTYGDRRSRWNVPTMMEQGFNILAYTPLGIVAPKGMGPTLTKQLHDVFNRVLDDPEYDKLLVELDMVDLYKSSEDYAEWAADQFRFQRSLLEKTIGLGGGIR